MNNSNEASWRPSDVQIDAMIGCTTMQSALITSAELKLKELSMMSCKITERCYFLLNVMMAIIPVIIGVIVMQKETFIVAGAMFIGILLCIVISQLVKLIYPRKTYLAGEEPEYLLRKVEDDQLIIQNLGSDIYFMKRILYVYQYKIEKIQDENNQRAQSFQKILYSLILILVITLFASILFQCYSST